MVELYVTEMLLKIKITVLQSPNVNSVIVIFAAFITSMKLREIYLDAKKR